VHFNALKSKELRSNRVSPRYEARETEQALLARLSLAPLSGGRIQNRHRGTPANVAGSSGVCGCSTDCRSPDGCAALNEAVTSDAAQTSPMSTASSADGRTKHVRICVAHRKRSLGKVSIHSVEGRASYRSRRAFRHRGSAKPRRMLGTVFWMLRMVQ